MFLPFLPQDNGVLDASANEALEILNADLASLLLCEADQFWRTLLEESSINSCLTSYLQFARSACSSERL